MSVLHGYAHVHTCAHAHSHTQNFVALGAEIQYSIPDHSTSFSEKIIYLKENVER